MRGLAEIIRLPRPSDAESDSGPHRPIRFGEIVRPSDVANGVVPERIYGGRRNRESLPEGVFSDRRQSHRPNLRVLPTPES